MRVCRVWPGAPLAPAARTDLQRQQQTRELLECQMIPPDGLAPGRSSLAPRRFPVLRGSAAHTCRPSCGSGLRDSRERCSPHPQAANQNSGGAPNNPPNSSLRPHLLHFAGSEPWEVRGAQPRGQRRLCTAPRFFPPARARCKGPGAGGGGRRWCFRKVLSLQSGQGQIAAVRLPLPARVSWSQRNPQCSGASLTGGIPERT